MNPPDLPDNKKFYHSFRAALLLILILTLTGITFCTKKAKDTNGDLPELFESENNMYGYKDSKGNIIIEAKYLMALGFNKHGVAQAVIGYNWYCIDRRGKPLLKIFNYDNGPDYFEEGFARYVDDKDKMGFINEKCEIVIPAEYDFAWPFENGKAKVCEGCTKSADHEMLKISGGKNYEINSKGEVIH